MSDYIVLVTLRIYDYQIRNQNRDFNSQQNKIKTKSCTVARKPRNAAAVVFGLKFTDNIHYKFNSSQASKARLQSSKDTGAKQNLTQNGHSRSRVLESVERR